MDTTTCSVEPRARSSSMRGRTRAATATSPPRSAADQFGVGDSVPLATPGDYRRGTGVACAFEMQTRVAAGSGGAGDGDDDLFTSAGHRAPSGTLGESGLSGALTGNPKDVSRSIGFRVSSVQAVDRSFVWDAVLDVDFFLPVDVVALAVEIGIEVEGDADGLVMVVAGSSIPRTGV